MTKSCSLTSSQRRRLNSSKQSHYRTNEIDSFRLNLSATSAVSLTAEQKDNALSDSQSSSRKTRIPMLVQSKPALEQVEPDETKVKQRFKQPRMVRFDCLIIYYSLLCFVIYVKVNFPRRYESFTPITYCTKRTMNRSAQHSSWETIPSGNR